MSKRKFLSPEAEKAVQAVMRKACERMERRSKSDRALALFEAGIPASAICARLGIDIYSIHTMLRCVRNKRARAMVRLCDEIGPNV